MARVGDAGTFEEPLGKAAPLVGMNDQREVAALKIAILVVGLVILISCAFHLALVTFYAMIHRTTLPDPTEGYRLASNIINVVTMAGGVVLGFLLVTVARRKLIYSVRELLYPALLIVGTYMVFIGALGALRLTAYSIWLPGRWTWQLAMGIGIYLPQIVGGVVLILVGNHKFPLK